MQTDYIEPIESTPILHSKKCKLISLITRVFLQSTTIVTALIAWYLYDYFVAIATLLLVFIVMGIVRAKIRNEVIPITQSEHHYNDKSIASWYTDKQLCDDSLELNLEKI